MRKLEMIAFCLGFLLTAMPVQARQAQLAGLRFWSDPDNTRVVFDMSEKPDYRVRLAENPNRLIVELHNAGLVKPLVQPPAAHPLLSRVRSIVSNKVDLRVEVALKAPVTPKSFTLPPNEIYGNRLVIDLSGVNAAAAAKPAAKSSAHNTGKKKQTITAKAETVVAKADKTEKAEDKRRQHVKTSKKSSSTAVASKSTRSRSKDIIVAIDAGHGGEDPGAHGQNGTEEKEVVFAIAKKLEKLMKNYPGIRPVMVRSGDYYIGLRKRMEVARDAKADLFISIHADAYQDSSVRGASVFTLSPHGASSEAARWLADSENGSDLVGGVSLSGKDDVLASVLLDLSQTATQEASQNVAKRVLKNFSKISTLHHEQVQKAGFVVLKSPDIPSFLVETAFISNTADEQNLRSERYQKKIAQAIFNGILDYFQQNPPIGTRMASSEYSNNRDGAL
ncbi:MAG: N-acetylmuramoyl-L-alanine amidase [Gammaproteobacteria bacterium]